MILRSRELEQSLGVYEKKIEKNETQTVIVQRRAIRAKINITKGQKITKSNTISLRPCPKNGIEPFKEKKILGKKIKRNILKGDLIKWEDLKS